MIDIKNAPATAQTAVQTTEQTATQAITAAASGSGWTRARRVVCIPRPALDGVDDNPVALKYNFRRVFDRLPKPALLLQEGYTVCANRASAELFGVGDPAALFGQPIASLLNPQSLERLNSALSQELADGIAPPLPEERILHTDSSERSVEIALAALPGAEDTRARIVIVQLNPTKENNVELQNSRRELRALSASMVAAREEERRRIARELHDDLGQRLSALKMDLATLRPPAPRRALDSRISAMLEMIDQTVASVRRIATDLRPSMLDDLGLNAAIEWLARDASKRMGIEIELQLDDIGIDLGDAAVTALYRMVQEALTNVGRHSDATRVTIELTLRDSDLTLTVQDNGAGFTTKDQQKQGSYGLLGLRERAHMLGGTLSIVNSAEGGARICLQLPLDSESHGLTFERRQAAERRTPHGSSK